MYVLFEPRKFIVVTQNLFVQSPDHELVFRDVLAEVLLCRLVRTEVSFAAGTGYEWMLL